MKKRTAVEMREYQRRRRAKIILGVCEVCGWGDTVDLHHGNGRTHILCPNHHALISRRKSTIDDLMKHIHSESPRVTPVTPDDRDTQIKILRAKVLMLETELAGFKKEKKPTVQGKDWRANGGPVACRKFGT
jgi:hypothetical protein